MNPASTKRSLSWGFFSLCRIISSSAVTTLTGVRHINVPRPEHVRGAMLACNHQSYFDPVLVGMALPLPLNYLARSELFEIPGFSRLIRALGAHPVRQGAVDRRALRTVMALLRVREPVLLFPEGTRTSDGGLCSFQPGIASLAIRCNAHVIPVCIEGAFRSWPRSRMFPAPARIAVMYGEPIVPDGSGAKEEFMLLLQERIARMQTYLRKLIGR